MPVVYTTGTVCLGLIVPAVRNHRVIVLVLIRHGLSERCTRTNRNNVKQLCHSHDRLFACMLLVEAATVFLALCNAVGGEPNEIAKRIACPHSTRVMLVPTTVGFACLG